MKRFFKNLSVFLPTLAFLAIAQFKEGLSNHEDFKEWYRMSAVLNKAAGNGYKKSALIVGNSATYTGINPDLIKNGKLKYFNFSRGGSSSLELLLWLHKNNIHSAELLPELNSRDFQNKYMADFDILKTESEDPFDVLKAKLEIELRRYFENEFSFLMYRVSLIDYAKEIKKSHSLTQFVKFAFLPENINPWKRKFHASGFYEEQIILSRKEIDENKRKYAEYYKEIMNEKKNYASKSSEIMGELVGNFTKNGSRVTFLRLPKDGAIIDIENKLTKDYYTQCLKLAQGNKKINYIDLSKPDDIKKYSYDLVDGVHWSAKGAAKISKEINSRLK